MARLPSDRHGAEDRVFSIALERYRAVEVRVPYAKRRRRPGAEPGREERAVKMLPSLPGGEGQVVGLQGSCGQCHRAERRQPACQVGTESSLPEVILYEAPFTREAGAETALLSPDDRQGNGMDGPEQRERCNVVPEYEWARGGEIAAQRRNSRDPGFLEPAPDRLRARLGVRNGRGQQVGHERLDRT